MEVVGEAEDGRAAVEKARALAPHVVIMDIAMPDLNGVDAARQIKAEAPEAKVVALSMQSDGPIVRRMLQAGASGYMLKDCASEELVKAIRTVVRGGTYLSDGVQNVVVKQLTSPEPATNSPLPPKEREVLPLLAERQSTKES